MRILAIPNWSFAREKTLLRKFRDILSHPAVELHYLHADIDHNRTVTAFSGEDEVVVDMVFRLALAAFDVIDLTRHVGSHPRIGALDVCPIVVPKGHGQTMSGSELMNALAAVENLASHLASNFEIPIFLYEKSERGRHEADLPSLRKGGFGGLMERTLKPDFGPAQAHARLGATVVGVREFQLTIDVDLDTENLDVAAEIAALIRQMRSEGDDRMLGVRAMKMALPSRKMTQVSLDLTLPNVTGVDPIVDWIYEQATDADVRIAGVDLIGVIRDTDMPTATHLDVRPEQIVATD
jgi:glutamate formiminotransferase